MELLLKRDNLSVRVIIDIENRILTREWRINNQHLTTYRNSIICKEQILDFLNRLRKKGFRLHKFKE